MTEYTPLTTADLKIIADRTATLSKSVRNGLYGIGFRKDRNLTIRCGVVVTVLGHRDGIVACLNDANGHITRHLLTDATDVAAFLHMANHALS